MLLLQQRFPPPKQGTILQCSQVAAQCRIQRSRPYLELQAFLRKNCGYAPAAAMISAPKKEAILQCSQVAGQCRIKRPRPYLKLQAFLRKIVVTPLLQQRFPPQNKRPFFNVAKSRRNAGCKCCHRQNLRCTNFA